LVSIEKIYQTIKIVFEHIVKHVEVRQQYSATCHIFNSPLDVLKCGQTRRFVFDILRDVQLTVGLKRENRENCYDTFCYRYF